MTKKKIFIAAGVAALIAAIAAGVWFFALRGNGVEAAGGDAAAGTQAEGEADASGGAPEGGLDGGAPIEMDDPVQLGGASDIELDPMFREPSGGGSSRPSGGDGDGGDEDGEATLPSVDEGDPDGGRGGEDPDAWDEGGGDEDGGDGWDEDGEEDDDDPEDGDRDSGEWDDGDDDGGEDSGDGGGMAMPGVEDGEFEMPEPAGADEDDSGDGQDGEGQAAPEPAEPIRGTPAPGALQAELVRVVYSRDKKSCVVGLSLPEGTIVQDPTMYSIAVKADSAGHAPSVGAIYACPGRSELLVYMDSAHRIGKGTAFAIVPATAAGPVEVQEACYVALPYGTTFMASRVLDSSRVKFSDMAQLAFGKGDACDAWSAGRYSSAVLRSLPVLAGTSGSAD